MSILKLNYIKYFLVFFLFIFFSCELPIDKEVERAEKLMWTSSDEYPTVPRCENFVDAKKRFGCLHDYLNNYLINNLKNNSHIIDLKFNDSLKIKIVVDKNGKIYSEGIDFKNSENDTQKIKSIKNLYFEGFRYFQGHFQILLKICCKIHPLSSKSEYFSMFFGCFYVFTKKTY